jgi:hypothetical protein
LLQGASIFKVAFCDLKDRPWKTPKYMPYVFTEQGIAMLSSVLNSERAVEVNIQIMRTFVKLREMMSTHKDLPRKLSELEKKYGHPAWRWGQEDPG